MNKNNKEKLINGIIMMFIALLIILSFYIVGIRSFSDLSKNWYNLLIFLVVAFIFGLLAPIKSQFGLGGRK